jgi:ABC-type Fe3+ transport system permease subunit
MGLSDCIKKNIGFMISFNFFSLVLVFYFLSLIFLLNLIYPNSTIFFSQNMYYNVSSDFLKSNSSKCIYTDSNFFKVILNTFFDIIYQQKLIKIFGFFVAFTISLIWFGGQFWHQVVSSPF